MRKRTPRPCLGWHVEHFVFRKGDEVNPDDVEKCKMVKENKHVLAS